MENTSYHTAILRKIRDDVISTLADASYTLSRQYSLSAINQLRPTLQLCLLNKSMTMQTIKQQSSAIRKVLHGKFSENFQMTTLDNSQKNYRLDFTEEYEIRANGTSTEKTNFADSAKSILDNRSNYTPVTFIESDIKSTLENKLDAEEEKESRAGRKKGKLTELQETIERLFDTHTSLKKGDQAIGYVVVPRTGNDNSVTFSFKSNIAFELALVCLEPGYYKQMQIVSKKLPLRFSVSIEDSASEAEVKSREEMSLFFTNLKKAINTIGPRPKVLTSFVSLTSGKEISKKVQLQFMDPGDAVYVSQYLNEHFKVGKEGSVLTVEATLGQISTFSQQEIRFKKVAEKRGLMTIARDAATALGYVRMSTDYSEFHFLKFNRKTLNSHVVNLVESIKMFGYLQFIIVIETDMIDGTMKKWIVDGQHRFKGCKAEGMPILYTTVRDISSKYELVRLIAKLNSTSKAWNIGNYVDAWESILIKEYQILKEQYKKTKLAYTLLISIYENMHRKDAVIKFMDGKFEMRNPNAEKHIDWIMQVQTEFLDKNRNLSEGLYDVIKRLGDTYDQEKMLRGLRKVGKHNLPFLATDTSYDISSRFLQMYNA